MLVTIWVRWTRPAIFWKDSRGSLFRQVGEGWRRRAKVDRNRQRCSKHRGRVQWVGSQLLKEEGCSQQEGVLQSITGRSVRDLRSRRLLVLLARLKENPLEDHLKLVYFLLEYLDSLVADHDKIVPVIGKRGSHSWRALLLLLHLQVSEGKLLHQIVLAALHLEVCWLKLQVVELLNCLPQTVRQPEDLPARNWFNKLQATFWLPREIQFCLARDLTSHKMPQYLNRRINQISSQPNIKMPKPVAIQR